MFKRYIKIVKKFFNFGATNKWLLINMAVSMVLWNLVYLCFPLIAALIIDALMSQDFVMAMNLVFVFLGCGISYVLVGHWHFSAYTKNSIFIHNKLQELLLRKVVNFDEGFSQDLKPAFVANAAFADIQQVVRIPDVAFDAVMGFVSMGIAIGILFGVNIYVGGFTVVLCVLAFFAMSKNTAKRDYYLAKQRGHQDDIAGLMGQALDGNKEINAFNMEDDLTGYLNQYKKKWQHDYFRRRHYHNNIFVLVPMIFGLGKIAIYVVFAILILQGRYELSLLVLVIGYFKTMEDNFSELNDLMDNLSRNTVRVERLAEVFNYKTRNMQRFGKSRLDNIKGKVEFRKVTFEYDKQARMKNMSFTIEPKSFVAIMGKSGCGKSTIFRVLLRLYKVSEGQVLLDGQDIYDYAPDIYARNVSMVTQRPFMFDMTIRENLSLVDPNRERQVAACKKAGVHNFIMSLPDGYNTRMLRDAENISAGHKQLLALARTLLSGSEVLLFDEVTSSLDLNASMRVMRVVKRLKKDHTVLMITHKPELARMADEIMVIDDGCLVGRGRHRDLIAKNKYYRVLQGK